MVTGCRRAAGGPFLIRYLRADRRPLLDRHTSILGYPKNGSTDVSRHQWMRLSNLRYVGWSGKTWTQHCTGSRMIFPSAMWASTRHDLLVGVKGRPSLQTSTRSSYWASDEGKTDRIRSLPRIEKIARKVSAVRRIILRNKA